MIIKVACRIKKHHLIFAFLDYLTVYEREHLLMLTSATNLSAEDGDFLVDFADCKNPSCNTPAC